MVEEKENEAKVYDITFKEYYSTKLIWLLITIFFGGLQLAFHNIVFPTILLLTFQIGYFGFFSWYYLIHEKEIDIPSKFLHSNLLPQNEYLDLHRRYDEACKTISQLTNHHQSNLTSIEVCQLLVNANEIRKNVFNVLKEQKKLRRICLLKMNFNDAFFAVNQPTTKVSIASETLKDETLKNEEEAEIETTKNENNVVVRKLVAADDDDDNGGVVAKEDEDDDKSPSDDDASSFVFEEELDDRQEESLMDSASNESKDPVEKVSKKLEETIETFAIQMAEMKEENLQLKDIIDNFMKSQIVF